MAEIGKVLLMIFFVIIAFGGGLYIRTFLTRKAMFRVIEIFMSMMLWEQAAARR